MKVKEGPLPYVPISPALKKSKRFEDFVEFADLYDDPFAPFYIYNLLLFAGDARVNGNLGVISARKLAKECVWQGKPEVLLDALLRSKWLVPDSEGNLWIEGWERHGGRVLKERLRWRRRHGLDVTPDDCAGDSDEPPEEPAKEVQALRGGSAESPRESVGKPASAPVLKVEGEGEYEEKQNTSRARAEYRQGQPIETVEQFQEFVAKSGWQAVLSPNQVVVATRILDEAPIADQELAYAASITTERAKSQGSRPSVGLFLSIVKGERARKPKPGSEHEQAEREGRERSPPRTVFKSSGEEPFTAPIGELARQLVEKLPGNAA